MVAAEEVFAHLARTTDEIIGRDTLISRLQTGRRLNVKYGVDLTAPSLHLGHAVNLWMMRYLQDLGNCVIFLLGDTTTQIGDPTGRTTTRPVLSRNQIDQNASVLLDQVGLVLRTDPDVFTVRRNSEWYGEMPVVDLLYELSLVTHAQLMSRDMFQARINEDRDIAMHEVLYPVLQGYDSVALESHLTIVGSDQLFNEMTGRHLQGRHGQVPQSIITTTITPGLDGGPKQSKSLNNYVGLADSPSDKLGKLMTLKDSLIGVWATVYTDLSQPAVAALEDAAAAGGPQARDAKLRLAHAIVARYHGAAKADSCLQEFVSVYSCGRLPREIPSLEIAANPIPLIQLLAATRPELSGSARRRLITEGGVRLNDVKATDIDSSVSWSPGDVLQAGRRHWYSLQPYSTK